jgi:hypothetical protein
MGGPQTAKPNTLMLKLVEELKLRLPTYTYTQSMDANGFPTLLLSQSSTPTAGQNNAYIKIINASTAFVDSINSPQSVFSPDITQIVLESAASGNGTVDSTAFMSQLSECIVRQGTIDQWYTRTNGTVPSATDITTANLQSTTADAYFPLSMQ